MKRLFVGLGLVLLMGGCAALGGNEEYTKQLDAWARGQEALAVAQAARFQILSDIADKCPPESESCVTVVGATAAVAVAGGGGSGQTTNALPPAPPADWKQVAVSAARDVLVVAAPAYAQVAMNAANQVTAQVQSNDQANVLTTASNATRDVALAASSNSTALATAVVQSGQAAASAQVGLLATLANILPGLRPNVTVARDYVSADNGSSIAVDASANGNNRTQGNNNNVDTKGQIGNRSCVATAAPASAQPSISTSTPATSTTAAANANNVASVTTEVVSGAPTNNCGD